MDVWLAISFIRGSLEAMKIRMSLGGYFHFSVMGIVLALIFVMGCHQKSGLPPIEALTDTLVRSLETGDEKMLNRCFVTMDNTPEGLARRDMVLELIRDYFPSSESEGYSVEFEKTSFSDGLHLQGNLTAKSGSETVKTSTTSMKVNLSIAGWKIISMEKSSADPAP